MMDVKKRQRFRVLNVANGEGAAVVLLFDCKTKLYCVSWSSPVGQNTIEAGTEQAAQGVFDAACARLGLEAA